MPLHCRTCSSSLVAGVTVGIRPAGAAPAGIGAVTRGGAASAGAAREVGAAGTLGPGVRVAARLLFVRVAHPADPVFVPADPVVALADLVVVLADRAAADRAAVDLVAAHRVVQVATPKVSALYRCA